MNFNLDDIPVEMFSTLQVIRPGQEWELPLRRTFKSYQSFRWEIRLNILHPISAVLYYENLIARSKNGNKSSSSTIS